MRNLRQSGLDKVIREVVDRGTLFLGICLGLQLLFECGDEGAPEGAAACLSHGARGTGLAPATVFEAEGRRWVRGLGILGGSCSVLPSGRLKIPHVGWDQVHLTLAGRTCPLLKGFAEGANLYFTHSFALDGDVALDDVAARTFYARDFASVVWHGNIFGCQFHPEKSSAHGLEILRNFVAIVAQRKEGRA